ncbi:BrnT family toxin [Acidithiobacillus caldus]|uniref:BrnT family toxin n=1 Tax=Acidithiobacillaceae TaxID=225058 RepID=UPI001C0653A7|nr:MULTISPECIES: BrnT family toxin [Acidithiobacillaceae]MBU2783454.1 BrnT family toxin [Acidithiobacillus caldus]MBU2791511.1 BrnT family toxin [Acidithiobacillus caldus]MBU2821960.1 BrnT family toxin [Acidithiobacillus caldus]
MQIDGFDWDSGNWPKCGKHGVSREEIESLFLGGAARVAPDLRHSSPAEIRHIAVGTVGGRALFVAFTIRARKVRPISARYMHEQERLRYEESTHDDNR